VRQLASHLQPRRIALDFDRTLATTRSGGKPIIGKDTMDPDLLPLLWERRTACAIVTRNSNVKDITAFLQAQGAPSDIQIHSLRKPRSKAEYITPWLEADSDCAIFVDDSIDELMDASISKDPRVHRVLFIRGLL